MVDEAKLSLFASIDSPETPSSAGIFAYLRKATQEERQRLRDLLLKCTPEDITAAARQHLSFSRARVSVVGPMEGMPKSIEDDAKTVNGKWQITIVS
jgi:Zn-dependent M16 (insulinase) family peptidase